MFDFSKYNLQELQAMSDLLDYLREDARADSLSYFCGCSLLQAIKRESLRLSRSILTSLEWQAAAQAEAEKVDRIKQAREATKVRLSSLYGTCAAEPASAPPAEGPEGLQALVDTLSRCSDQLAALALAEDKHFAECSQMDSFMKLTVLRNANRSIIDLLTDIRDHYDGLH